MYRRIKKDRSVMVFLWTQYNYAKFDDDEKFPKTQVIVKFSVVFLQKKYIL
jgi:hypothetical protein